MTSFILLLQNPERRWQTLVLFLLVALQAFIGPLDLQDETWNQNVVNVNAGNSLEATHIAKLAVTPLIALVCLIGILRVAKVREVLLSVRSCVLMAIVFLTVLGATSGVSRSSIPASILNFVQILFVVVALCTIDFRPFAFALTCGMACFIALGLFFYFAIPDRGVFFEMLEGDQRYARLAGVAHPNAVARISMFGLLLSVYLFRTREIPTSLMTLFCVVFALGILLARSRTSHSGRRLVDHYSLQ